MRSLLLIASLAWLPMQAQSLAVQDFRYLVPLEGETQADQLSRVLLTPEIYQLSELGLQDIAIFDAEQRLVEHEILDVPSLRQASILSIEPQIYYVPKPIRSTRGDWSLELKLDNEQRISWRTEGIESVENVIILDLGSQLARDWQLRELQLRPKQDSNNLSLELQLDSSHDLNNWQSLGQFNFTFLADQGLGSIPLNKTAQRFLRITWSNTQAIELSMAKTLVQPASARRQDLMQIKVSPVQSTGQGTTWHYPVFPSARVQGLNFDLARGEIINGRLVGVTPERLRQSLGSHEWVNQPNMDRRSPDLQFNNRQFASIELISTRRLEQAPDLLLNIIPQQILFAAQGQGPYSLAIGSQQKVPSNALSMGLSQESLMSINQVQLQASQENPSFRQPGRSNLQTLGLVALWAAILAALIALGLILRLLAKQMKQESKK